MFNIFLNFLNIYVNKFKESIADISTQLTCSGDLKIPGNFFVQGVVRGTDDCVQRFP